MKSFKVLGAVLAGALLAANAVSAAPNEAVPVQPMPISAPLPQDSYGGLNFHLFVNGKGFSAEEAAPYAGPDNELMVPIRAAAEALGYELTWHADSQSLELAQSNQLLYLQIGQDNYSADKIPVSLDVVPELTGERTYVPVSFFEKVMKLTVTADPTGVVTISSKEQAGEQPSANPTRQGTITSITSGDKIKEIGLNGYSHGLRLNISDDTEIVSADNKKLTFADLQLGMSIEAEHSPVMAMSMPPMTSAKKVIVKERPASEQVLGTSGTVEEITAAADGTARLVIKGTKLSDGSFDTIVLNVDAKTPIVGTTDNQPLAADQLKQGDQVYAFYGPVLTRSLPPIGKAVKIVVEN